MMNINEMTVEEMELAVFDLECTDCKECPFKEVCGKHELFWGLRSLGRRHGRRPLEIRVFFICLFIEHMFVYSRPVIGEFKRTYVRKIDLRNMDRKTKKNKINT